MDEAESKQSRIEGLDDIALSNIFMALAEEMANRDLSVNEVITKNEKEYLIICEELDEDVENLENGDDDLEEFDDYYEDSHDLIIEDTRSRTPNDDRSDSMNPNSPRYNP